MRKFCFLLLPFVIIISTCEKDEPIDDGPNPDDYVNIPDIAFLSALIEEGVDSNGDSLISYAEAEFVDTLLIGGFYTEGGFPQHMVPRYGGIKNLEGIEAFKNLKFLDCSMNELIMLDVSKNHALSFLECWYNQLTSLDVSGCTSLCVLLCNSNELTSLDLTNNNELDYLRIGYAGARYIEAGGQDSQFGTLDISANTKLEGIEIASLPQLTKVCVWTTPFPPEGVGVDTTGSPNVYFTTDCSK